MTKSDYNRNVAWVALAKIADAAGDLDQLEEGEHRVRFDPITARVGRDVVTIEPPGGDLVQAPQQTYTASENVENVERLIAVLLDVYHPPVAEKLVDRMIAEYRDSGTLPPVSGFAERNAKHLLKNLRRGVSAVRRGNLVFRHHKAA